MHEWIHGNRIGIGACTAVISFSLFLFIFQLGTKPFWDYDEAIYANVIYDTLQSGAVLTLQRDGQPWFQKPPLVFWTSMAIDRVFHHPELSYRLTAALAGIASIVFVMLIVYEVGGGMYASAIAGFALTTTGPFLMAGRELRLDVPAVAMILLAVYSFIRGQRNSWWFIGVGAGIALGFMAKSVIGLLSLPCIFFWFVFMSKISPSTRGRALIAILTATILLVPWHLYEHVRYGSAFWQVYLIEVLQHVGSDTLGGSSSVPYYVSYFFTNAAPWSILFFLSLIWLITVYKKFNAPEIRTILVFAGTTLAICTAFLLSRTKIHMYLQPVYPFVAITIALCGTYIYRHTGNEWLRYVLLGAGTIVAGVAVCTAVFYGYHVNSSDANNDQIVAEEHTVAGVIASQPTSLILYAYNYDYYDTIEYYSARRDIKQLGNNPSLSQPFLMIAFRPFMDAYPFPDYARAHFSVLYSGQLLMLYKYNP
jgi:4-amino-4-deoxy-L-arabinose transferase-like glycosyltransferase